MITNNEKVDLLLKFADTILFDLVVVFEGESKQYGTRMLTNRHESDTVVENARATYAAYHKDKLTIKQVSITDIGIIVDGQPLWLKRA